jgi:hypothetical protein
MHSLQALLEPAHVLQSKINQTLDAIDNAITI